MNGKRDGLMEWYLSEGDAPLHHLQHAATSEGQAKAEEQTPLVTTCTGHTPPYEAVPNGDAPAPSSIENAPANGASDSNDQLAVDGRSAQSPSIGPVQGQATSPTDPDRAIAQQSADDRKLHARAKQKPSAPVAEGMTRSTGPSRGAASSRQTSAHRSASVPAVPKNMMACARRTWERGPGADG